MDFLKLFNKKNIEPLNKPKEKEQRLGYIFEDKMLNKFVSSAEKLSNVLSFAKYVGWKDFDKDVNGLYPVHNFIKLLARRVLYDRIFQMTETSNKETNNLLCFSTLFSNDRSLMKLNIDKYCKKIDGEINILLNSFPVITGLWCLERFKETFKSHGTYTNAWKEDTSNHMVCLYLPIGLVVSERGHHSIANGEVKGVGTIHIHKNSKHKIYDISRLYSEIKFNGEHYISLKTNEILCKAESFEFGCIFEIGRILYENKVDFLGFEC